MACLQSFKRGSYRSVFLDYSKAFDCVSFNCLLRELHGIGIRGNLLSWFRSYLTDRLHMTVIDGRASSLLPISSGVPQESILGPLLFIIYINSAPSVTDAKTTVQLYADDMKCYRVIDNGADAVQLQRDLLSLTGWSSEHFMNFNANKCKHLVMTKKKKLCTHHII